MGISRREPSCSGKPHSGWQAPRSGRFMETCMFPPHPMCAFGRFCAFLRLFTGYRRSFDIICSLSVVHPRLAGICSPPSRPVRPLCHARVRDGSPPTALNPAPTDPVRMHHVWAPACWRQAVETGRYATSIFRHYSKKTTHGFLLVDQWVSKRAARTSNQRLLR